MLNGLWDLSPPSSQAADSLVNGLSLCQPLSLDHWLLEQQVAETGFGVTKFLNQMALNAKIMLILYLTIPNIDLNESTAVNIVFVILISMIFHK